MRMAWWSKLTRRRVASKKVAAENGEKVVDDTKTRRQQILEHFGRFAATRRGVEAYIEPPTNVTQTTMILIAASGEWTRRRVPDAKAGWALARELQIPVYDINQTGYPQRMRDWNSQQRAARKNRG